MVSFKASGKNLNLNDESQHGLLMQLLKLSYNCLNYDFIGTSTDESSDDLCTVQIPTSWRSGGTEPGGRGPGPRTKPLLFLLQRSLIPPLCNSFSTCIIPSRRPFPRWYVSALAATDPAPAAVCAETHCRVCAQVLSCLVQIASVRRSLFNNAERAKFLSHLVDGVKRILANPQVRVGPAAPSPSVAL